jgi:hypothetical protein
MRSGHPRAGAPGIRGRVRRDASEDADRGTLRAVPSAGEVDDQLGGAADAAAELAARRQAEAREATT